MDSPVISEPVWVREDAIIAIHRRQIAEHGGSDGIRDAGLLASALARPQNLLSYGEPPPDFAALAAAYAYGIAQNHPFIDGNKRSALVVCRTFLLLNGYDFDASQEGKYRTFFALAAGDLSEEELANWVRNRIRDVSTGRDSPQQLTISGNSLTITPVNVGLGSECVEEAIVRLRPRYAGMLSHLAK